MPLLSIRGYARHRKVSHVAVLNAIKSGRITKRKDGKIDSALADRQWVKHTDPSKPRNSVTGNPGRRKVAGVVSLPMDAEVPLEANGRDAAGATGYLAARTVRETYLAKTAKLEYERALGKLVDADEVRSSAFKAGRGARESLMNLPARLTPTLVGLEEAAIFDALSEAIRSVCDEINRSLLAPAKKAKGTK